MFCLSKSSEITYYSLFERMYKLENINKKTILFVSFITACYPHVSAIAFATPENVLLLALAVLGS